MYPSIALGGILHEDKMRQFATACLQEFGPFGAHGRFAYPPRVRRECANGPGPVAGELAEVRQGKRTHVSPPAAI